MWISKSERAVQDYLDSKGDMTMAQAAEAQGITPQAVSAAFARVRKGEKNPGHALRRAWTLADPEFRAVLDYRQKMINGDVPAIPLRQIMSQLGIDDEQYDKMSKYLREEHGVIPDDVLVKVAARPLHPETELAVRKWKEICSGSARFRSTKAVAAECGCSYTALVRAIKDAGLPGYWEALRMSAFHMSQP